MEGVQSQQFPNSRLRVAYLIKYFIRKAYPRPHKGMPAVTSILLAVSDTKACKEMHHHNTLILRLSSICSFF